MLDAIRRLWNTIDPTGPTAEWTRARDELLRKAPVPVFWLFGKAQSGKTSVVRFLTGAEHAVIGDGFKPTTKFSSEYAFPSGQTPILKFLDTRGVGEPNYDPAQDLAKFNDTAHLVVVAVRAMDHAQESVVVPLRRLREAKPARPVLLLLTCLHDGYLGKQHPAKYPFGSPDEATAVPTDLARSIAAQKERFAGLFDRAVPVDLTTPDDGFEQTDYGGPELKAALADLLPAALRQTVLGVGEVVAELEKLYEQRAEPVIRMYAGMAAGAGAIPVPWVDLPVVAGVQAKMAHALGDVYGQPMESRRFLEMAGAVGLGLLARQALREAAKFIPGVGALAGGALSAASTYALGRACCWYYGRLLHGHVPRPDEFRNVFSRQMSAAEMFWKSGGPDDGKPASPPPPEGPKLEK
jgi:uncharacterized protein (DUF697 family)